MSQTSSGGLSLKDMANFFRRNGKLILLCGLSGLLFVGAYVAVTPNKFEARWQLQVAQFVQGNSNNANASAIEDPAVLIQRLRLPTAYPDGVRRGCGMPEGGEFGDYLGGALEINIVKNVTGLVEMKVYAASPSQAMQCAQGISAMIVAQQHDMIEGHLAGYKAQLRKYQQALAEVEQQLERIKKSEILGFAFLSSHENRARLQAKIDDLADVLQSQLHPAQLTAPIYVPAKPVSPKVGLVLALGAVLGVIMGILFGLGREGWRRIL